MFDVVFPKCINEFFQHFINFSLCGIIHVFFTYSKSNGHGKQIVSKILTNPSNLAIYVQSMIAVHESITTYQGSTKSTNILHFALTFLLMWNRQREFVALGNIILMSFIKARSLSQTMTLGPICDVKSDPLNFCSACMKFFSFSPDKNAKPTEKDKPVQVTPTISSKGRRYLFIL